MSGAAPLLLTLLALTASGSPALPGARAEAESRVAGALVDRGLAVEAVRCRRQQGWHCRWRAGDAIAGWAYRCSGEASLSPGRGAPRLGRCRRRPPKLAPVAAQPGAPPAFGFNDSWRERPDLLDEAVAAGADANRFGVSWMSVEPRPDHYRWELYDPLYQQMVEAGARPVLVLISAPCWAQVRELGCRQARAPAHPPSPRNVDDFAEFAAAAAERYPQALAIEVWNEPNSSAFWRAPRPQPALYARLLAAAKRAIARGGTGVPVISGGLAPFGTTRGGHFRADEFLHRVYRSAAGSERPGARSKRLTGPIADAIAIHPYPGDGGTPAVRVRTLVAQAKAVQLRHGDARTPLWVTEFGLSTSGAERVSELGQARGLVAIYETLRRVPGVPVVLVHRLTDLRDGPRSAESGWGVLEADGTRKPAYCALAGAVSAAAGGEASAPSGC